MDCLKRDAVVQEIFEFDVVSSAQQHFCVVFPFHPGPEGCGGEVGQYSCNCLVQRSCEVPIKHRCDK